MIKSVNHNGRISIYWAVSFSLLFNVLSLHCFGQGSTKKKVTEKDYSKWGTLHTVAVAEGSDWISFRMVYENTDTLFVKNSKTGKAFLLPKGTNGKFVGMNHFVYRLSQSRYELISLSDSGRISLSDTKWLESSENQKYILTAAALTGALTTITVRDIKGRVVHSIADVIEYSMSPGNDAILYTAKIQEEYYVGLLDLDKLSMKEIVSGIYPYTALVWQKNSQSVAFIRDAAGDTSAMPKLYFYVRKGHYLKELDMDIQFGVATGRISVQSGLQISGDGDKVFFSMQNQSAKDTITAAVTDSPEIWYSNTRLLYPTAKWIEGSGSCVIRHVWYPDLGSAHNISTAGMPDIELTGKENYVITRNLGKYPANYKFYPDTDYCISSLKDRNQIVFLEKQSSDPSMISTSPVSDLVAYYKGQDWYLYDPVTELHRNLTSGIGTKWDTTGENIIPPIIPYGVAGWSVGSGSILLYDTFDIWQIDLNTGKGYRITNGREQNTVFRLDLSTIGKAIDPDNGLLLVGNDHTNASRKYYLWRKDKSLLNLCADKTWNDEITGNREGKLIFREQSFESSPRLVIISAKSNKRHIVHYSNTHQKHYDWGASKLVHYSDENGNDLKAALLYPAGYTKGKMYPMVVLIYESMSQRLHQYKNPSMHNEDGFNAANYTLDGYFVLLPDIHYEIGKPGKSAMHCITAAVRAALDKGSIDRAKIGLIGHSFGGYETNMAIAQTSIFAAAVSGAGVSDATGMYFNIGEDIGDPEAWRFESQQYRMGKSIFEDRQGYIDNSPIMHADSIQTPLLIWSGKKDSTVPVSQSIAMHIALRRLGKENIFLSYSDESHVISNKSMQEDLTRRIRDWFGYFLKDDPAPEWITKGLK